MAAIIEAHEPARSASLLKQLNNLDVPPHPNNHLQSHPTTKPPKVIQDLITQTNALETTSGACITRRTW